MGTANYTRPDSATQTAAQFKAYIDAMAKVFERLCAHFAPHEQTSGSPSPDMSVVVDAGFIWDGSTLSEKAQQTVTGFTAPTTGFHRIDRVVIDTTNGDAKRVVGTEASGSPSAVPPAIPSGHMPCCQVLIQSTDTSITNDMITPENVFPT